jgi:hypothetical protein
LHRKAVVFNRRIDDLRLYRNSQALSVLEFDLTNARLIHRRRMTQLNKIASDVPIFKSPFPQS